MINVSVLDAGVDIDVVGVEEIRVFEGRQERLGELVGEEGVFVGCLVAADLGVDAFLLEEHPVEEGAGEGGDVDGAGGIDAGIDGELDALDEVEDDGVFEATESQLPSIPGGPERTLSIRGGPTYISWYRMLDRSSAALASERSIVESIFAELTG